ncbi:hypothetical protein P8874_18000 [Bacillus licheniformis]|uniref:hypothetical protein n=1 Tax=Bacillus TaxID=1386 RepID=UPI0022805F03|nr:MULTISPECIES: hypothetical protein [Bacillus]MCY8543983.1 hypothetical protein [Bacillus haynesii]MEC0718001.1 hypothetical protein [Bacillus licheniformis]
MRVSFLAKATLSLVVTSLLVTTLLPEAHAKEKNHETKPITISSEHQSILKGDSNEGIQTLDNFFKDKENADIAFQNLLLNSESFGIEFKNPNNMQVQWGTTKAVKEGIKALLKNKKKLFNYIESFLGKRARKSLELRFDKYVKPTLNELLEYEELAWGTLQGHLSTALHNTGIKNSTARNLAYFITQCARWIL